LGGSNEQERQIVTDTERPGDFAWSKRWNRFRALSPEQRLELATSLLRRDPLERRDFSFTFVRKQYPHAADSLIHSIVHHLYWTLPTDFCDLMAYIELCMRDGEHHAHNGLIYGVLYNLYNLTQAEALIPDGRQGVYDWLAQLKECIESDDREGALATLKSLMEKFESNESPPDYE
jgi:hypothetical protein